MSGSFTGDFKKLGLLQASMARLAKVPSQLAGDVTEKIADEIRAEFAAGQDPYGRAWAALSQATLTRGRFAPPLTDTGDTIDSLEVKPMAGAGVSISFGTEYAGFHQTGTKNMPARQPLPTAGFPSSWSKILSEAAEKKVAEALR